MHPCRDCQIVGECVQIGPMDIQSPFDRIAVRTHRDRAAAGFDNFDFLVRAAAEGLAERLDDIAREFPKALVLGCGSGALANMVQGHGGILTWVQCDLSPKMAAMSASRMDGGAEHLVIAADEEALPFATGAFDMVLSALDLHWVNDLPGALIQARQCLRPDGLFLAAVLGGETLTELRRALLEAESELESGASPRVSPFLDVRDAGDLLQRAGFALAVADTDTIRTSYSNPLALMADLRGMGESNAIAERRKTFTRRATLMRAAEIYIEAHGDHQGRIPATFQIITMTAWAPAPSQPKPLAPGSAKVRLASALGAEERPAGEAADPKLRRP